MVEITAEEARELTERLGDSLDYWEQMLTTYATTEDVAILESMIGLATRLRDE